MLMIADFIVDAVLQETHTYSSTVTSHPVESGSLITDHVRNEPITYVATGIVSDTPIGSVAAERSAGSVPSSDALDHFIAIHAAREPITVITEIKVYENMVMRSLTIPRDAGTGRALRFSASFQQIELVTNERTTVRVAVPRVSRKEKRGTKTTSEETSTPAPAEVRRSTLSKSVGQLRQLF